MDLRALKDLRQSQPQPSEESTLLTLLALLDLKALRDPKLLLLQSLTDLTFRPLLVLKALALLSAPTTRVQISTIPIITTTM